MHNGRARLVEVELPDPGEGEVLVRNTYLTVDPYMRGRMNDVTSYVPPFALDAPMDGGAVGVVEQVGGAAADGTGSELRVGDTVLHNLGWRTHAVLPGRQTRVVDAEQAPAQAYLGVLGMPGHTAYTGLLRIAGLQEGDDVIAYCRIGERSSHTWFVLKYLLGHEDVRNYDGSWTEWGNAVRLPIAVGEEPGEAPAR